MSDFAKQLTILIKKYGMPVTVLRSFEIDQPFSPINKIDKRVGEAIFVVRRPGDKFLMCTKDWYTEGIYRFPGGGINHGENIEDALFRELKEELGLESAVEKFLASIYYHFSAPNFEGDFASFVFLFPQVSEDLEFLDTNEGNVTLKDFSLDEIEAMVGMMRGDKSDMKDWSAFRSVVLETVVEVLKKKEGRI